MQKCTEPTSVSLSLAKQNSIVTTENGYVMSKNEKRLGKADLSLLSLRRQLPQNCPHIRSIYKKGKFIIILSKFQV
jgi:hypothetical protein